MVKYRWISQILPLGCHSYWHINWLNFFLFPPTCLSAFQFSCFKFYIKSLIIWLSKYSGKSEKLQGTRYYLLVGIGSFKMDFWKRFHVIVLFWFSWTSVCFISNPGRKGKYIFTWFPQSHPGVSMVIRCLKLQLGALLGVSEVHREVRLCVPVEVLLIFSNNSYPYTV